MKVWNPCNRVWSSILLVGIWNTACIMHYECMMHVSDRSDDAFSSEYVSSPKSVTYGVRYNVDSSSYLSNCVQSKTGGYPIRQSRFLRVDCVIRDWNVQRCRVACITSRNLQLENEICKCISVWKVRPIYLDLMKDYQYQATNENNALEQFRWILYITQSHCAEFSKMVE